MVELSHVFFVVSFFRRVSRRPARDAAHAVLHIHPSRA